MYGVIKIVNIEDSMQLDGKIYTLQLITNNFIFYCDIKESDENSCTVMIDRKDSSHYNNYFAYEKLVTECERIVDKDFKDIIVSTLSRS